MRRRERGERGEEKGEGGGEKREEKGKGRGEKTVRRRERDVGEKRGERGEKRGEKAEGRKERGEGRGEGRKEKRREGGEKREEKGERRGEAGTGGEAARWARAQGAPLVRCCGRISLPIGLHEPSLTRGLHRRRPLAPDRRAGRGPDSRAAPGPTRAGLRGCKDGLGTGREARECAGAEQPPCRRLVCGPRRTRGKGCGLQTAARGRVAGYGPGRLRARGGPAEGACLAEVWRGGGRRERERERERELAWRGATGGVRGAEVLWRSGRRAVWWCR